METEILKLLSDTISLVLVWFMLLREYKRSETLMTFILEQQSKVLDLLAERVEYKIENEL